MLGFLNGRRRAVQTSRQFSDHDTRSRFAQASLPELRDIIEPLERRLLLSVSYAAPQTYPVGPFPQGVAVADLGNGHPDVVAVNFGDNTVSVLLGNGDGTFQPQRTFATDVGPQALAIGDLGNGHPDLVVTNGAAGTVSVLLGNGDGTFQPPQNYAVRVQPDAVAIADLGDGVPSVVVANSGDNTVSILHGNGDGTLQEPGTFSTGINPSSIAVTDLGNGIPDIVVANSGDRTVGVLQGEGDNLFAQQQTYNGGADPLSLAVADLGNGFPDIITANATANNIGVLVGNGDGSFQSVQTYAAGQGPQSIAVGDLGDGHPDVVTANVQGRTLSILLGNGDGTFQPQQTIGMGTSLNSIAIADLGNGLPDLIVSNPSENTISVLLGHSTSLPPAALSVKTSGARVDPGAPVTFTANVASSSPGGPRPGGSVVFLDNGAQLGSAVIDASGVATLTTSALSPGTHAITASYSGDASNAANMSAALTQTVITPGSTPVTIVLQSASASSGVGAPVALTVSVSPAAGTSPVPSGYVSFYDSDSILATVPLAANGTARFYDLDLTAGSHSINAVYFGDATYAQNSSNGVTQTVTPVARIGGLDPNFGVNGLAGHDVGFTKTSGLAVQPDGKSLILGVAGVAGSQVFAVTRYNADGGIDTTFGDNGVANTSFGGDDVASSLGLLPNGDLVVVGTSTRPGGGSEFAIAEYTPAGALDTSFGGTGMVLASFSTTAGLLSNDSANTVVIGPSGTLYVGGSSDAAGHGLDFAIAAFSPNGSYNTAFGNGGKVLLDFSGGDDSIASLALQSNGDLVAAGRATSTARVVAVARFLASGVLDLHFGIKGKLTTAVRNIDDAAASVVIDPKGKLIVGGYSANGSAAAGNLSSDFLVLRYTNSGKLDRSFGTGGVALTSFGQPAAITRVALNADGSISASGKTVATFTGLDPTNIDVAVARYTSKGKPDPSFDGTGHAIFSLNDDGSTSIVRGPRPASLAAVSPADASSDLTAEFAQLIGAAQGVLAVTAGGELLVAGNSNSDTVVARLIVTGLDLEAKLIGGFPAAIIGGAKGTAQVQITEAGSEMAAIPVTVELFPGTQGSAPIASIPEKLKLKSGQSKVFKLKFNFPASLPDGSYFILSFVNPGSADDLDLVNNGVASAAPVEIAKPFIDLSGKSLTAKSFVAGSLAALSFGVTNSGNESAIASIDVDFFASTDGTLANEHPLHSVTLNLSIKPGTTKFFKETIGVPVTLPAGSYKLIALLDPNNTLHDPVVTNNLLVSSGTFTVV